MEAAHKAGLQDAWTQIPVHATLVNWLMTRDAGGMGREAGFGLIAADKACRMLNRRRT